MPTVSRATLYRRFYLYAALAIAVASASVAAAVLLRTVLQVAGLGPRPLDADVSRAVSLSAAILAFALPVGAVHLVCTIAFSWAARTPPESPRARVRAAAIVLLVAMLVAVAFLGNAASAAGDL